MAPSKEKRARRKKKRALASPLPTGGAPYRLRSSTPPPPPPPAPRVGPSPPCCAQMRSLLRMRSPSGITRDSARTSLRSRPAQRNQLERESILLSAGRRRRGRGRPARPGRPARRGKVTLTAKGKEGDVAALFGLHAPDDDDKGAIFAACDALPPLLRALELATHSLALPRKWTASEKPGSSPTDQLSDDDSLGHILGQSRGRPLEKRSSTYYGNFFFCLHFGSSEKMMNAEKRAGAKAPISSLFCHSTFLRCR